MKTNQYVLEVAVFTVKAEHKTNLPAIRAAVHQELHSFKGLISLDCYSPIDGGRIFADIARWETMEDAQVAAKAFAAGDFRFLPYIDAIEEVQFMGHFAPESLTSTLQEAS